MLLRLVIRQGGESYHLRLYGLDGRPEIDRHFPSADHLAHQVCEHGTEVACIQLNSRDEVRRRMELELDGRAPHRTLMRADFSHERCAE